MARYIGPKTKIARKFGEPIFGPDKSLIKSERAAGNNKHAPRKKKMSVFGTQLAEKQKAKYTYGLLEKQFSNLFTKAHSLPGVTGEVLMQLLECRLDNIVYRMGLARTRAAARQLVTHRHITVDGEIVKTPSYSVKPGQVISVTEGSKSLSMFEVNLKGYDHAKYSWIEWKEPVSAKYVRIPERAEIPENINEQLIVEHYSK
ncbi:RNA-binding S4 domain protein [Elusimicrobium minutum Pei191]|uniref:Small ribosomal subunit protein uS4 n=1 Tax=Elusimicrobium minutum (strain Pei191) TaxID=445932 RepID=RS4_ELUMP|nr:30S ribosomal protein S4 [Elusimicrobium minutum]B2KEJ4.1 RecName: Full=Small ribosomal subunit protein uS4; AltName: Full=30S ribosomal protein S4 [Elusimicrobium minutum Pei191]ACC98940.1 RNA-binding S4 domain protein [Elusimicrobium minutum Pei191]